ncbi:DUF6270 domain-containing protein [Brevibacterium casei]|uniref:DUF6270 domain-containing protein n=1 Tax=Brevibacterium casei TaxID=33889 RepID=UPI003EB776BD
MKIAIFGSCVSRDTCEFLDDSMVVEYVARQSVTSLLSPRGISDPHAERLESAFQRRMVISDLQGTGADRVIAQAAELDLVLIDLVDERRGYWQFPDGSTMTNSLEVESCGAADSAAGQGARLVEFGSDEHFERWKRGFEVLMEMLSRAQLRDKLVFLDIEWASAIDGSPHPDPGMAMRLGRTWRRLRRRVKGSARQYSSGNGVKNAWSFLIHVKPTEAEEYADRATQANVAYKRYREFASSRIPMKVTRRSEELRINREHKWGPQPFHYRDSDYETIVKEVRKLLTSNDIKPEGESNEY